MEDRAPAKVNLFLEILGKRPDGFHEIVTVMQELELADTLAATGAAGSSGGGGKALSGTLSLRSGS